MKEEDFNKVNCLLMKWNPIGVEGPALEDEYRSIIPTIVRFKSDRNKLVEYLKNAVNELGLEFDENDQSQINEIDKLASEIGRI